MSSPIPAAQAASSSVRPRVVNDFTIQVATVNGSGSQTANMVLLRSIFQMGVPVSGKNLFPSNIQGLPTWFTIRVNKDGYIARRDWTSRHADAVRKFGRVLADATRRQSAFELG